MRTDMVHEGGALGGDGEDTAIITESCVLNDNRNRGWSSATSRKNWRGCSGSGR